MARKPRVDVAGEIYHVVNRGVARRTLFHSKRDYEAFEGLIRKAYLRCRLSLLAWCLMPNHWHFVVRPEEDGQMGKFFAWLTQKHVIRHHRSLGTVGEGSLYQGRYKSYMVSSDAYCLTCLRYVERNPLAAGLVDSAEQWPWSSAAYRAGWNTGVLSGLMSDPPVDLPPEWIGVVNRGLSEMELHMVESSLKSGRPFGDSAWVVRTCQRHGLRQTLNDRGRPKKGTDL